ncbi:MAG TPA: FlgD immunoglobulin-like domain containing protein, partial [Candidatus Eisenbacteria bacterium]|nr:FlgD immunoglobulin-like domain containing protein [Candidatus Eisenbacteria bacterium]
TPAGGVYSGDGVDPATGVFTIATAGVGPHVIRYTFTDANGCDDFKEITITVNNIPTVTLPPVGPFCIDAVPGTVQLAGTPAGGVYSGDGVDPTTGVFTIATAGVGPHVIRYCFTDANGCDDCKEITITVNDIPTVTLPPAGPFCIDAVPATYQLLGTPTGGVYSGDGVNPVTGVFTPATAGVGPHTIRYTFTAATGCDDFKEITITVNDIPTVTLPPAGPFCIDRVPGAVQLAGTPAGGVYSGDGVDPVTGVFTIATAGAGPHVIRYTFTAANGCDDFKEITITVNPLPDVTLAPAGPLCNNVAPVQLNGQPTGGTYSGPGVSSTGLFSPATTGNGNFPITYTYTDPNGCTNSASIEIEVRTCELACWLTAGGARIRADGGRGQPVHSWGGNVYPGCSPTAGDGGNWNHIAHALNLHFQGRFIEVVRCGNVPGIPPGSSSPATPVNFIEFRGTGRVVGTGPNHSSFPLVYFFARCEDRAEPGSGGQPDPNAKDRYFLHVYLNPANPIGSTVLLVDANNDANAVDPVMISDGNMQIHVSSCDGIILPRLGSATGINSALPTMPELELAPEMPLGVPIPNPFRDRTAIHYLVEGRGAQVDVSIYDVTGRRVKMLVGSQLEPGRYETSWDGRDDQGQRVAHGLYFVRMVVGGQVQKSGRVLYLKQ